MSDAVAAWGRIRLRPIGALSAREWRTMHGYFRDRELADWNGASPIRLPEWLFRRIMLEEEGGGERHTFGIYDEGGRLIGSVELYDLARRSSVATLGIMIGERTLWGQGYGREAVCAVLAWAFTQRVPPLSRVRLRTFSHNRRAQRAFLAAGFHEVGREERRDHTDVLMEITREEWQRAHPGSGQS